MQPEIFIRNYTPEDKADVIELLRLNTPEYFSPEEESDLIFYLDHETEQYFVVEHDNIIAGCGGINFDNNGAIGKISWDILHPLHQGKGIGTQLLNYRINKLRSLPTVKTIVVRTSQLAYQFYEKNCFKLMDVQKDYWAEGFDLYRMAYVDGNH